MNQRTDTLLKVLPNDDILSQCIHCGMCLATCPTYEMTKLERSSPRGRIKMIKSVARREMPVSEIFADEMSFCLDCQACETACPAGVKYGIMVEAARVVVEETDQYHMSRWGKLIKKIVMKYLLSSNLNLKIVARLLYFYQKSGLQKFLHLVGFFKFISNKLGEIDSLSPSVSKNFSDSFIKEVTFPNGEQKYKTAFLTGCLMNVMFADINKDTIDFLSSIGSIVYTPKNQFCCGSLQAHNGYIETAKELAKKNINVFEKYDYDFLVSNSAGCGAFMKEYGYLFEDDPEYAERAKIFSNKVKDVTEFLTEVKPRIKFKESLEAITYHDACHLVHSQKVFNQPREVLKSIPGLTFNELEESTWCCGSAGIYNVVRYEDSLVILKRKMEKIKATKAKVVLTGNPGCIAQLKYGAKKFNVDVEVMHPVSFIRQLIA